MLLVSGANEPGALQSVTDTMLIGGKLANYGLISIFLFALSVTNVL